MTEFLLLLGVALFYMIWDGVMDQDHFKPARLKYLNALNFRFSNQLDLLVVLTLPFLSCVLLVAGVPYWLILLLVFVGSFPAASKACLREYPAYRV